MDRRARAVLRVVVTATALAAIIVLLNRGFAAREATVGGRSGCIDERPAELRAMDVGEVVEKAGGPFDLVAGYRDESAIVVAICATAGTRSPTVALRTMTALLRPVGGMVAQQTERTSLMYAIFASDSSSSLTVEVENQSVGTVKFKPAAGRRCSLTSSNPALTVVGCGTFVVLDLRTALPIDPREVQIVDGEIFESAAPDHLLGFFYQSASSSEEGLMLRIGFTRPTGASITVRLHSILTVLGVYEPVGRQWDVTLGQG